MRSNSRMNLTAKFFDALWSPRSVASYARVNFTPRGCLSARCVSVVLLGLQVMRYPLDGPVIATSRKG